MLFLAYLMFIVAILALSWKAITKVFGLKEGKKVKRYKVVKEKTPGKLEETLYRLRDVTLNKIIRHISVNKYKREELEKYIKRLEVNTTPEKIKAEQILYSGIALIVSIIIFNFSPALGGICALLIPILWMLPEKSIYEEVQKRDEQIKKDFPGFFSMVYYAFRRTDRAFLRDVIIDYLPNASPAWEAELNIFLEDEKEGEAYALKRLRNRVQMREIIRFCDMMETRLDGYDNIATMTYFKQELSNQKLEALNRALDKKVTAASRIQDLVLIPLGILFLIYFSSQLAETFQFFK